MGPLQHREQTTSFLLSLQILEDVVKVMRWTCLEVFPEHHEITRQIGGVDQGVLA
jgi:hypothetical protein